MCLTRFTCGAPPKGSHEGGPETRDGASNQHLDVGSEDPLIIIVKVLSTELCMFYAAALIVEASAVMLMLPSLSSP
jgi:hypothetical protein